jgi:hypothetical protein
MILLLTDWVCDYCSKDILEKRVKSLDIGEEYLIVIKIPHNYPMEHYEILQDVLVSLKLKTRCMIVNEDVDVTSIKIK